METMAIAAMSVQMGLAQTQQAVDVTMTKKAMNLQESQAAALLDSLQTAIPTPNSYGHQVDMYI